MCQGKLKSFPKRTYFSCGSPALTSFALGFTSRCIVGTVLLPFTVVKTHAEAGLSQNRSTFVALQWIYKTTKLKGR